MMKHNTKYHDYTKSKKFNNHAVYTLICVFVAPKDLKEQNHSVHQLSVLKQDWCWEVVMIPSTSCRLSQSLCFPLKSY